MLSVKWPIQVYGMKCSVGFKYLLYQYWAIEQVSRVFSLAFVHYHICFCIVRMILFWYSLCTLVALPSTTALAYYSYCIFGLIYSDVKANTSVK